jgi:thioesterase domain-containing protein
VEQLGPEWFVSANENGSHPPLIMVQAWPEESWRFESLAKRVSAEQPLYGILCPTEPSVRGLRRVEDWIPFLKSAVSALPVQPPFNVFGWSFGGLVALELARALGDDVGFIGLVDTWMPRNYEPLHRMLFVLNRIALQPRGPAKGDTLYFFKKEVRAERRLIVRVSERIAERIGRLAGGPRPSLQNMLEWKTYIASRRLVVRPINRPVTFFSATETEAIQGIDASWDWARLFVGGFEVVRLDAGHWAIWEDQFIDSFAHALECAVMRTRT